MSARTMHVDGDTKLVGIIADPIAHVRTPRLFNASVANQVLPVLCVPFHVGRTGVHEMLHGARSMKNLLGIVVTIPHKEAVLEACSELSDVARLVGAANVLRLEQGAGRWVGGNFDGDGFIAGLRAQGHDLRGLRVLLLGAGGAAKSIAYALARAPVGQLVVHNRSAARAQHLVNRLKQALPEFQAVAGSADPAGFDVVVNATALGLHDEDELPLESDRLGSGTIVCEAVVREGDTPLLAAARRIGCTVHHGQHMLYGQIVEMARFLGVPLHPDSVARIVGPH